MLVPFVAACLALLPAVSGSDNGWVSWGQSLYKEDPDGKGKVDFPSAVKSCEKLGAHIAVPSSQAENDFIWELKLRHAPWIDCWRNEAGEWGCAEDGCAGINIRYRNWSPRHQDKDGLQNRQCTTMAYEDFADAPGQWRARPCHNLKWVLCEKRLQQPAPLPNVCPAVGGDGQSCLTAKLLKLVQCKHLSKVEMHEGGSRYSISVDPAPGNATTNYSVLSSDVKVNGMKAVSWNIAVHYANETQHNSKSELP